MMKSYFVGRMCIVPPDVAFVRSARRRTSVTKTAMMALVTGVLGLRRLKTKTVLSVFVDSDAIGSVMSKVVYA